MTEENHNSETIQLIEVTLHPQKNPRVSAVVQASHQPTKTLLPVSSIANLKELHKSEYEVFVKQGCLPQAHFTVGQITATFPANALTVLNQR